ncbi:hypothetical protein EDC55_11056 [Allofrancisella inopinata]|uniref:Acid phosphatase n=1 Tax=Allofrancisella inopinata TaxID=1085647 RepID=A0AAE6YJT4_9GAMM|nr:HAD family acid phosphatase [Allofrancisella inopinata]QIV96064.1 hypothetical protein E4K63_04160 [Allofrancisella inopinata]TDT71723.1 hypothetical protein EDC55_11056 [Allofrancisella inopinata]
MKKISNITLSFFLLSLGIIAITTACSNNKTEKSVDPLELYTKVTQLETAFDNQYEGKFKLPENAKKCISKITQNSDVYEYMGSKDGFDYSENSQYTKVSKNLVESLNKLMSEFIDIGFIKAIQANDKRPALMFDIDNTLELTSFDDDYFSKGTRPTPYLTNFVKKQCFKNGVDCYFITARYCNMEAAISTEQWLKQNLNLTNTQISKYVFLSGSINDTLCATQQDEKIAYKDSFRQALAEQRNVYWLMSIGDQMTDWHGSHSGLKVKFPNQMFQSNIVPNNFYKQNDCNLKTVIAPSLQCYNKIKSGILEHATVSYCKKFKDNKYYSG